MINNNENERWKLIESIEDLRIRGYEISDCGRVRDRKGKLKAIKDNGNGYKLIGVKLDGKTRNFYIHRLVVVEWCGGFPGERTQTRHLDGNRSNNHFSNLVAGTVVENEADKERHGTRLRGEDCTHAKLTERDIQEIFRRFASGESSASLAAEFMINKGYIGLVLARKRWTHVEIEPRILSACEELRERRTKHRNRSSRFVDSDIIKIRTLAKADIPQKDIAKLFDVAPAQISQIVSGKRWGHLPL